MKIKIVFISFTEMIHHFVFLVRFSYCVLPHDFEIYEYLRMWVLGLKVMLTRNSLLRVL